MAHDQTINLARGVYSSGQRARAEQLCRQVLASEPNHVGAWNLLSIILKSQGRLEEAKAACERVIQLTPDAAEVHSRLAMILTAMKRFDEAVASHQRAVSLQPDAAAMHEAMGATLLLKTDPSGAAACFRRAVELSPRSAMAWNALGMALRSVGQFDEAADCFQRAIEINPDVPHFHSNLALINAHQATPEVVDRLTRILSRGDLPVEHRIEAGFALGKLLDDAERFDEAFAVYAQANALVRQSRAAAGERYDAGQMARAIDTMIQAMTAEFFAERRSWGPASELPVFIMGMPRSGTSLVEQIAASHPAVFGAGELSDINQISRALAHGNDRLTGAAWNARSIAQAAENHLKRLGSLSGSASRVIDKLPGNVLQLGLIAVLFPGARVIFCRRDARDTCLSCYFQQFPRNEGQLFIYDLADCGRHCLQVQRLTAHWLEVLPLRMVEIQYEDLVADLEFHSRRLIDFLGLPWNAACLEFYRTRRPVQTSSVWQVRQPIYTRSVGRWRHYEKHLGPLLKLLPVGK